MNAYRILAAALLVASAIASSAAAATVVYDNGTTFSTTAITEHATDGSLMVGMAVTAYFSGGGSETADWAAGGGTTGGATGTGWSLSVPGDTFSATWTLAATTASIVRLVLNGVPGGAVFDIEHNPFPGTEGSANGRAYQWMSGTDALTAIYHDRVALNMDSPVGDLWRELELVWDRGAPFANTTLGFRADTDNSAGLIGPQVPEPSSWALLGIGLACLAFRARRRAK